VLCRRDQGEADRVLTLCTPMGKLHAIAKGARKVRSRKAGHIELFSRSNFVIARVSGSWDIISQAETVESHAILRSHLLRGTYARYAIELFDRFFAEGEGGQAMFDLLDNSLTWLCEDDDFDLISRFYEQHLLELAGFRPELFYCVGDHRSRVALLSNGVLQGRQPYGFDIERGGALCPDCYELTAGYETTSAISSDTLRLLQECQESPYSKLRRRPIPPSLHRAAEPVVRRYITYHLECGIKALTFLDRLRREMTPTERHTTSRVQQ